MMRFQLTLYLPINQVQVNLPTFVITGVSKVYSCKIVGHITLLIIITIHSLHSLQYMSRLVGKPTMWFPNRSDKSGCKVT